MRSNFFLVLVVTAFAASCVVLASAKEEVEIKTFAEMWRDTFAKMKQNPGKFRGWTSAATNENAIVKYQGAGQIVAASTKNWETAIVKINAGAKLEKLDTAPTSKWKTTFDKLKASGQLKNVDEAQAAKITEGIAQEVVKNPSKWRYVKRIALISFGALLTALIIIGLQLMLK